MNDRQLNLILTTLLVLAAVDPVQAQMPRVTSPQMQQMISQPPVDIESPVEAMVSIDPPVMRVGNTAMLRVTLNALDTSIRWPDELPLPAGLTAKLSARGQVLQPAGSMLRPFTTLLYELRASRPGFFTIPAHIVEVYGKRVVIPSADIEALDKLPGTREWPQRLVIECDSRRAFIGQQLPVRVLAFANESNMVQGLSQVEFRGGGFLETKSSVRRAVMPVERHGQLIPAYIYETRVTPIAAGQQTLSVQGFSAGNDFGGPIVIRGNVTIPGGPPRYLLMDSEPITVHVRPVPVEGRLPGFTGAVGDLSMDVPQLATNILRVGDPVQLAVTIRSDEDLSQIQPPDPPRVIDWQVFPAESAGTIPGNHEVKPGVVFNYTLIPMSDESKQTPAIPFSYFDPHQTRHVDITIPPVPVRIIANGLPTDWPESLALDEPVQREKPALSGLALSAGKAGDFFTLQSSMWFPVIALAPVAVLFGLLWWDERRRFLENHPEVVRRNLARREYRRQRKLVNRAAATENALDYAKCAVTAMQIACAPHLPAAPRALVCADVLNRLDSPDRHGALGAAARELFSFVDNSEYSQSPRHHPGFLNLKADVEQLLAKLEEKL